MRNWIRKVEQQSRGQDAPIVPSLLFLVAYMQRSLGVLIWIGAGIAHLLKTMDTFPLHELNEWSEWNKHLFAVFICITLFSLYKSCQIFYTPEKYEEYTKGMVAGQGGILVPNPDTYFYPTMISDIGIRRKIAGYVYAISKIVFFITMGAILYLGVRLIFNK